MITDVKVGDKVWYLHHETWKSAKLKQFIVREVKDDRCVVGDGIERVTFLKEQLYFSPEDLLTHLKSTAIHYTGE